MTGNCFSGRGASFHRNAQSNVIQEIDPRSTSSLKHCYGLFENTQLSFPATSPEMQNCQSPVTSSICQRPNGIPGSSSLVSNLPTIIVFTLEEPGSFQFKFTSPPHSKVKLCVFSTNDAKQRSICLY